MIEISMRPVDSSLSRRRLLKGTVLLGGWVTTWRLMAVAQGVGAFDEEEKGTLAAMVSRIIPSDATPGAQEAGITTYLGGEAEKSDKLRKLYDAGLKDLDKKSQMQFGSSFAHTAREQQEHVLREIASSEFFKSVRNLAVRRFYSSQVGWQSVGYPGMGQPYGYRDFALPPSESRTQRREMDAEMMLPDGEERKEVATSCGQCHELSVVTSQRKTKEQWRQTVRRMVTQYHANFEPSLADRIVSYLSQQFGAD